jgi:hypothetical protein
MTPLQDAMSEREAILAADGLDPKLAYCFHACDTSTFDAYDCKRVDVCPKLRELGLI